LEFALQRVFNAGNQPLALFLRLNGGAKLLLSPNFRQPFLKRPKAAQSGNLIQLNPD
jgi:hypothetical protein